MTRWRDSEEGPWVLRFCKAYRERTQEVSTSEIWSEKQKSSRRLTPSIDIFRTKVIGQSCLMRGHSAFDISSHTKADINHTLFNFSMALLTHDLLKCCI